MIKLIMNTKNDISLLVYEGNMVITRSVTPCTNSDIKLMRKLMKDGVIDFSKAQVFIE